jgi:hypothetical protein
MTSQQKLKNRINTLLFILVLGNIVWDIANIALWIRVPSSQSSLQGGPIAKTFGSLDGLVIGTTVLSAISIIYATGLFGLHRRQKWAPALIIAVSIANRAFALLIFEFTSPIFYVWTVILVSVAYLDYRLLGKATKAFAAIGVRPSL